MAGKYKSRGFRDEAPDGFLAPPVKLNPAAYSVAQIKQRARMDEEARYTPEALKSIREARRLGWLKKKHREAMERKASAGKGEQNPPQKSR